MGALKGYAYQKRLKSRRAKYDTYLTPEIKEAVDTVSVRFKCSRAMVITLALEDFFSIHQEQGNVEKGKNGKPHTPIRKGNSR